MRVDGVDWKRKRKLKNARDLVDFKTFELTSKSFEADRRLRDENGKL